MHTQVWVVSYRDKRTKQSSVLGVFVASKAIVLESMEITYSQMELKPTITFNSDEQVIWNNGVTAELFDVKTRPDHL